MDLARYLVLSAGDPPDSEVSAVIFKTEPSALMKFIQYHEVLGKQYQCLYGESSIRSEAFRKIISFLE
jgi:hypothetical protein